MKVDLLIIATIHLLIMGGFSFDQKGFSGVDLKNNTTTSAPTVNDDNSKGYSFGSCWYNQSLGKLYILVDSSEGAANWISVNGENYKGSWNASTNIPVLADGIGITGDNYLVSVAGSQNLGSGTIAFALGDLIIYDGTIWKKGGISYTPEDLANKSTDGTMTANSATLYPSQSAVVTYTTTSLSTKQDSNLNLTSLASLTLPANGLLYSTGANTITTTTLTATARTVLDDNSTDAMLTTLAGGSASTGSGGLVRATGAALVNPALGTPASGVLTNCTGYTAANLPAGTSIQTVPITKTDTAVTTSSTYAAITGIAATITPGHINNDVRVTVVLRVGGTASARGNFQLFRGTTKICNGSAGSNRTQDSAVYYSPAAGALGSVVIDFVDSPVANTATTYTVKWSSPDNVSSIYLNRTAADTNSALFSRTASTIILTEIKG